MLTGPDLAAGEEPLLPFLVNMSQLYEKFVAAWLARFRKALEGIPEVVEAYRMSGEVDYLLRVVVPDIAGYDAVYKKLIGKVDLADVTSSFSMEEIKHTTALPLDHVPIRD